MFLGRCNLVFHFIVRFTFAAALTGLLNALIFYVLTYHLGVWGILLLTPFIVTPGIISWWLIPRKFLPAAYLALIPIAYVAWVFAMRIFNFPVD